MTATLTRDDVIVDVDPFSSDAAARAKANQVAATPADRTRRDRRPAMAMTRAPMRTSAVAARRNGFTRGRLQAINYRKQITCVVSRVL